MAEIVSFSLDGEDLLRLKGVEKNFRNRSEALRAGIEHLALEEQAIESLRGFCNAVVLVVHSHAAEAEISKVKHDFSGEIKTQVHNSLGEKCVEMFLLEGQADELVDFFRKIKLVRKVSYCKFLPVGI